MKFLSFFCFAFLIGVALSGCQRFKPEPLSATRGAAALESRSLADPRLREFLERNLDRELSEWPLARWDFGALTLAAFYFHPSLDLARAQWNVATAGIVTAGGRPNPTVTLVPEYSFNPPAGVSPWLPSITFDVPIETAGKRGHRMARARELSEAARLNIATTAWQVRSRLRSRLLDWTSASRRQDLLRQQQSLQEKIVAQLEQRLRAGTISSFELTGARIALARAQVELADLSRLTAEARARAAEAIGVPASALGAIAVDFDLSLPVETELASAEMREQALHTRPDILAALSEYAASQAALHLEIAKQYPDVHLGPGYQWDQGEHKWSLGVTVELPVLNRNQGPIAEATAKRAEAAARFEAVQAKALAEIDLATASYRGAQANLARLEELLAAQNRQQASVAAQFKAGAADQLEVLTAQTELLAAELLRLEGGAKAMQAFGQLEDAIQHPFSALSSLTQNPRIATQTKNP
jgi:cobalt-zinc-cadmium efflux system outer membrane protein